MQLNDTQSLKTTNEIPTEEGVIREIWTVQCLQYKMWKFIPYLWPLVCTGGRNQYNPSLITDFYKYYKSHGKFPLNFRISLSPLREKALLLFLLFIFVLFSTRAIAMNQDPRPAGLWSDLLALESLSPDATTASGCSPRVAALSSGSLQFGFWGLTGQGAQLASSALQEPQLFIFIYRTLVPISTVWYWPQ